MQYIYNMWSKIKWRKNEVISLLALFLFITWIAPSEEIRVLAPTCAKYGIETSLAHVINTMY